MILGIDLGTTNSVAAWWDGEKPVLVPNVFDSYLTPSAVGITDSETIVVGRAALEQLSSRPDHTITAFKRHMGTKTKFQLGDKSFSPEELSALVLKALKADAEKATGEEITHAIITVPAYFNDVQRKATKLAGELAGLQVDRLINEPTAAALAYSIDGEEPEGEYLVFDIGGGTFDTSIVEIFEGVVDVRASCGDNMLGGEDFVDILLHDFYRHHKLNAEGLPKRDQQRVRLQMEKLKRQLTTKDHVELTLKIEDQAYDFEMNRERFLTLSKKLMECIRLPLKQAIRDSRIRVADLDGIVMVGGASRMVMIRDLVVKLFGRFPLTGIDPDLVVATGAAVLTGMTERCDSLKERVLTDVCPYTLGVETVRSLDHNLHKDGYFLPIINRNTPIPVSREEEVYTVANHQKIIRINVYQGESRRVEDNVYLEELTTSVPPAPAGEQAVRIRFTYDINGLLQVEAHVVSTGEKTSIIIERSHGVLSAEEIKEALAQIASLRIHPRDQEKVQATLNRANRLYRELIGGAREHLNEHITFFEAVIEKQDLKEVEEARIELESFLDSLELF